MGTGKSTVARKLAEKLGWKWVDTDEIIESSFGESISKLVENRGESVLRSAEAEICLELSKQQSLVISTGGGTLMPRKNREIFEKSSHVFCLNSKPSTLFKRLEKVKNRPLLPTDKVNRRQAILNLLKDRKTAYDSIFHQIHADEKTPEVIADEMIGLVRLDEQIEHARMLWVNMPAQRPYPIAIWKGGLTQLGDFLKWLSCKSSQIAVVSNPDIASLYGQKALDSLTRAGFEACLLTLPEGEAHKNLDTIQSLYKQLLQNKFTRNDTLVALGGGVIGDMVGFAAATYLRGISFVQVPTTLLSMVDSSVGGKTGVDLEEGKNLVGAFKQPLGVLMDPDVLNTLPKEEFRSGLAEVIKHGVIGDVELFEILEKEDALSNIENLIEKALRVKIQIVEEDPFEQDRRALLNLGHTFGHAIEKVSGYTVRHGEAVAIGMVQEARLAHKMGLCQKEVVTRLENVLEKHKLPTSVSGFSLQDIYKAMEHDKKRRGAGLIFSLPKSIGDVEVVSIPLSTTGVAF